MITLCIFLKLFSKEFIKKNLRGTINYLYPYIWKHSNGTFIIWSRITIKKKDTNFVEDHPMAMNIPTQFGSN
jgi:hypothetical protein